LALGKVERILGSFLEIDCLAGLLTRSFVVGYEWNDDVVCGAAKKHLLCGFGLPGTVDKI
jgi:hypothetical protein